MRDSGGRRWLGGEMALGGLLLLLGILVLVGQAIDLDLGRVAWPVFVVSCFPDIVAAGVARFLKP